MERWSGQFHQVLFPPGSRRPLVPAFAGPAALDDGQELARRPAARCRILLEARQHELVELARNRQLGALRRRHRRRLHVLQEHLHRRVGLEHELAGQQVVGDAAERVDVGAAVDVALPRMISGAM